MKWKNFKLGTKCTIAFGSVVLILVIVATWSITGIGDILFNAEEVIEGNKLRTNLEEKFIQHMNWENDLEKLVYDKNATDFVLQTDPHKCDFGKWYYGEGFENVKKRAPKLIPLLEEMEEPHKKLHESALAIKKIYHPADYNLSIFIQKVKAEHLEWSNNVKD